MEKNTGGVNPAGMKPDTPCEENCRTSTDAFPEIPPNVLANPLAPEIVLVQPVIGTMYEPFQLILLPESQWTPVRRTRWIVAGENAGLLRVARQAP